MVLVIPITPTRVRKSGDGNFKLSLSTVCRIVEHEMPRFHPEHGLVIAQFADGNYANGCLVNSPSLPENTAIITAAHVARAKPRPRIVGAEVSTTPNFLFHSFLDIAGAHFPSLVPGFVKLTAVSPGEKLVVIGRHGSRQHVFTIPARVVEVSDYGEILIEKISGSKDFQVGMSGSPGVIDQAVIGVLSRGIKNKPKLAVLEPISAILA